MPDKILVAYATQYGSTREVAEAVAEALRACDLTVDVEPARKVKSIAEYSAVVLGAPLYIYRWHKDARNFLSRNRKALLERPAAAFAVGPLNDKEEDWRSVRENLQKELAKFPWFSPLAAEVFKFDPEKLTFPYNLIPAMKQMPPSDIRDWAAIRAWSESLVPRLQPVSTN